MAPELLDEEKMQKQYFGIRGGPLTYKVPTYKSGGEDMDRKLASAYKHARKSFQFEDTKGFILTEEEKTFQCFMSEIIFLGVVQGYIIRLEHINEYFDKYDQNQDTLTNNILQRQYQFQIDENKLEIIGTQHQVKLIDEEANSESLDGSEFGGHRHHNGGESRMNSSSTQSVTSSEGYTSDNRTDSALNSQSASQISRTNTGSRSSYDEEDYRSESQAGITERGSGSQSQSYSQSYENGSGEGSEKGSQEEEEEESKSKVSTKSKKQNTNIDSN